MPAYASSARNSAVRSESRSRYFEAFSKFKECAPQEVENYSAMIDNLERFKEVQANQAARQHNNGGSHRQEEF